MTNENKQIVLEMSKAKISELSKTLYNEIDKVHLFSTQNELNEIFTNCTKTMDEINKTITSICKQKNQTNESI
jgi:hypothetical protein